ncbi:FecR domain-containing protein [Chitinophaga sp. MM2321]|uniref:FecR family protein n=1 Tax=Chitinophaga sp. MM2321 TaxID=3137178 RepID=UPI0032D57CE9
MITRELITLFLQNACTEEEKTLVIKHFEAHPEELEKYLPEEEWINFKSTDNIPAAAADRITSIVLKKRGKIVGINVFRRIAAAVIIAGTIGAGWYFLGRNNTINDPVAESTAPRDAEEQYILSSNNTNSVQLVALADGSTVELSPQSTIRYKKAFIQAAERDVYLSGEALFKVSKDKARPFIVHSDNITTTALGTSFTISCRQAENTIRVQLHTGKVMVNTSALQQDKKTSSFYLNPGEELLYDRTVMTASINRMKGVHSIGRAVASSGNSGTKQPDWYMFNGMSISQVFDQLSDYYNVEIYYVPAELKNRYFTGKLNKNDSLNKIINDIALLNQLSVSNQSGRYIIKKIH